MTISFEGISSGTSPNATSTGCIIYNTNAKGAGNNGNCFYGFKCEANTIDLHNDNPYTEIYGHSIVLGNLLDHVFQDTFGL